MGDISKKNIFRKSSFILLFFAFLCVLFLADIGQASDNYNGSPISQSFSDPTKPENLSYGAGDGLAVVPGFPWFKESKTNDIDKLQERIDKNDDLKSQIIEAKSSLQRAKEETEPLASRWRIKAWISSVPTDPMSVKYNVVRLEGIKVMIINADLKLNLIEQDTGACNEKRAEITLKKAVDSGDLEAAKQAQNEVDNWNEQIKGKRIETQQKLAEIKTLNDASCWPGGSLTPNIGNCILIGTGWIGNIIVWIFALLLWLCSKLFDLSVYLSITTIRFWFEAEAVSSAWRLMRDFANIFFVFVLLYVSIGTIFDLKGIGDPKKMVTNVIIIALLVNFSGFFVRVVVDATNIVAYEFYSKMGGSGLELQTIGTKLVEKLNLASYFIDSSELSEASNEAGKRFIAPEINRLNFSSIIGQTFGNILIILATAFVLLIASILFIIRTVVLLFLYIISPLAFVSKIIPNNKLNKFEEWFKALIKQSLIAPAFLVPLYLVFLILGENGISDLGGSSSWGIAGEQSVKLILINTVILGLIVSCIFIAQKISEVGAEATPGFATKAKQLLSRPLSRYGGRLANRVGAGIAGSSVGQAASKSWNEGGLRLVRRSWDTGVLRTARESEYGKRAGQAIRNPLTTALGVQPFSVDARAKSILSDVKNLETDAQKSRFIEGLAGFKGKEEFDYIYDNMGTESAKVELAARKILADPSATAGAKKGAQMVADRMEENRKKLSGKKAQDIASELVKKSKDAQKLGAIEHLKQDDLNEVFKGLSRDERVELEKAVKASGNATLIANLGTAATKLKTGDATALKTATEAEAAYDGVVEAMRPGATTALVTDDIRKISREKIVELAPRILTDPGISQHLTTVQLEAIRNSDLVDDINKDIIRTNIEGEIRAARAAIAAGAIPRMPRNLDKLDKYFNGGAGSGF